MPYLYGRFKAEFRHAGKTLPYLESFDGKIQCSPLYPWSACGYGTYSGSAEYRAVLNIPDDGSYLLDLGRVEDLAEVFLDEVSVAVLIAPPYVAETGFLKQGAHELRITVCNGPGNRDRPCGSGIRSARPGNAPQKAVTHRQARSSTTKRLRNRIKIFERYAIQKSRGSQFRGIFLYPRS